MDPVDSIRACLHDLNRYLDDPTNHDNREPLTIIRLAIGLVIRADDHPSRPEILRQIAGNLIDTADRYHLAGDEEAN